MFLQGVCIEYNGEAKCDCPAPYAGPQCGDASEVADFMLNEINNNLASAGANSNNNNLVVGEAEEGSKQWSPDCDAGECRVPDFSGQSFLEFPTMDNVAKFVDMEVRVIDQGVVLLSCHSLHRSCESSCQPRPAPLTLNNVTTLQMLAESRWL